VPIAACRGDEQRARCREMPGVWRSRAQLVLSRGIFVVDVSDDLRACIESMTGLHVASMLASVVVVVVDVAGVHDVLMPASLSLSSSCIVSHACMSSTRSSSIVVVDRQPTDKPARSFTATTSLGVNLTGDRAAISADGSILACPCAAEVRS
jgi:PIN domain nuclease of toxin-antitoxin system